MTINGVTTPAEIEKTYGLGAGTVRQYIKNNRERMIADNVLRRADRRTWLLDRKFAQKKWGKS
jgi:hypothetical protein